MTFKDLEKKRKSKEGKEGWQLLSEDKAFKDIPEFIKNKVIKFRRYYRSREQKEPIFLEDDVFIYRLDGEDSHNLTEEDILSKIYRRRKTEPAPDRSIGVNYSKIMRD